MESRVKMSKQYVNTKYLFVCVQALSSRVCGKYNMLRSSIGLGSKNQIDLTRKRESTS